MIELRGVAKRFSTSQGPVDALLPTLPLVAIQ